MAMLYVNELAGAGQARARRRHRPAHPGRHPAAAWRGRIPTARSACGRSAATMPGSTPTSPISSPARASADFEVPADGVHAWRSTACAITWPARRSRARTAAAISPMRSTCWRATARRRSATCATSPTPSSTTSRRRSPRRRSPRRSPCSATRRAPTASISPRSTPFRRSNRSSMLGRADFGSALRDSAALVTLASEGARDANAPSTTRSRASTPPARSSSRHLDAGGRLAGARRARAGQAGQRHLACRQRRGTRQGAFYRSLRADRARRAAGGEQQRRRQGAGGGVGFRRAD